jgi:hypothetical protein
MMKPRRAKERLSGWPKGGSNASSKKPEKTWLGVEKGFRVEEKFQIKAIVIPAFAGMTALVIFSTQSAKEFPFLTTMLKER